MSPFLRATRFSLSTISFGRRILVETPADFSGTTSTDFESSHSFGLYFQAPFEDALYLKDICLKDRTPLSNFFSYKDLGHAFSPRIGYKLWRDTVGPVDSRVPTDIANAAAAVL